MEAHEGQARVFSDAVTRAQMARTPGISKRKAKESHPQSSRGGSPRFRKRRKAAIPQAVILRSTMSWVVKDGHSNLDRCLPTAGKCVGL